VVDVGVDLVTVIREEKSIAVCSYNDNRNNNSMHPYIIVGNYVDNVPPPVEPGIAP
jgi:hypothetical protein